MKKLLTVIFILCTAALFAEMRGGSQYDPGAVRSNLSNVDAAATPSMTSITLSDKVKAAWADILGDIYASGTVKVSTGTAAAPAYSFASDPNTGMYSPAADTVGVSVAGAEALRVNSAGEILIATSTDAGDYKLQVNGNAYVNGTLSAADYHTVAVSTSSPVITTGDYILASFTLSIGGNFANSVFTAPISGTYLLSGRITTESTAYTAGDILSVRPRIDGVVLPINIGLDYATVTGTYKRSISFTTTVKLTAGQTLGIGIYSDRPSTLSNAGTSNFYTISRLVSQ